jgi:hypothetical protein
MLLVAMSWRLLHRRRVDARLAEALRHDDPVRRRAAVRVATEQGLRPYAKLLIARIDEETDPHVRAALVEGVLRNAWEPADQPAILRLRLWAHEERARWQAAAPTRSPVAVPPVVRAPVVGAPVVEGRSATAAGGARSSGSGARPSPHPLQIRVPDLESGTGPANDRTTWFSRKGAGESLL